MTREEAIRQIKEYIYDGDDNAISVEAGEMAIEALSENKGEWTEWKGRNGRYNGVPVCSNCNTGFPVFAKDYNFCPNCGADMRGET